MSLTRTVPASVPSLFHSSRPAEPSSAGKNSVPLTSSPSNGDDPPVPGKMSLTRKGTWACAPVVPRKESPRIARSGGRCGKRESIVASRHSFGVSLALGAGERFQHAPSGRSCQRFGDCATVVAVDDQGSLVEHRCRGRRLTKPGGDRLSWRADLTPTSVPVGRNSGPRYGSFIRRTATSMMLGPLTAG